MSTSEIRMKKFLLQQLAATLFFAFFGAVYEAFGHGVYSYFMIYAFTFPLLMGVLPAVMQLIRGKAFDRVFLFFWTAAIASFSVGSVFRGVLDIYGTTNSLVVVYPVVGGILVLCALSCLLLRSRRLAFPRH